MEVTKEVFEIKRRSTLHVHSVVRRSFPMAVICCPMESSRVSVSVEEAVSLPLPLPCCAPRRRTPVAIATVANMLRII